MYYFLNKITIKQRYTVATSGTEKNITIFNWAYFICRSFLLLALGIPDSYRSTIRHCRKFREISQLFCRKEVEGGWNCDVLSRRQPFLIPWYRKLRQFLSVLFLSLVCRSPTPLTPIVEVGRSRSFQLCENNKRDKKEDTRSFYFPDIGERVHPSWTPRL